MDENEIKTLFDELEERVDKVNHKNTARQNVYDVVEEMICMYELLRDKFTPEYSFRLVLAYATRGGFNG